MTEKEMKQNIALLATYWPRFEVVEGVTWKAWLKIFMPVPSPVFEAAIVYLTESLSHPFPPSIVEVRDAIRTIASGGKLQPTAEIDWCNLIAGKKDLVSERGKEVLRMIGGQRAIGSTQMSQLGFLEARYCKIWNSLSEGSRKITAINKAIESVPAVAGLIDSATKRIGS